MGKVLEKTVKELIQKQGLKRSADQIQYHVNKEYQQTHQQVVAMLRARHKMPKGSRYLAELVLEPRGAVSNSYIVQKLEEHYPNLAHVIEQYRQECRDEEVERLNYGKR